MTIPKLFYYSDANTSYITTWTWSGWVPWGHSWRMWMSADGWMPKILSYNDWEHQGVPTKIPFSQLTACWWLRNLAKQVDGGTLPNYLWYGFYIPGSDRRSSFINTSPLGSFALDLSRKYIYFHSGLFGHVSVPNLTLSNTGWWEKVHHGVATSRKLLSSHTSHRIHHMYTCRSRIIYNPPGEVVRDFLSNNLIVPSSWNKLTFQFPTSKYLWFSLFHSYLGKISSFKEDFKKLVWTTILCKNDSQQLHRVFFCLQGFKFPQQKDVSFMWYRGFTTGCFLLIAVTFICCSIMAALVQKYWSTISDTEMVPWNVWSQAATRLPEWLLATLRSCTSFGFQSIWRNS